MRGHNGPVEQIGCLRILLVVFLPPLSVISKGIMAFIVVLLCTIIFWPLGSIAAAIYLGD